MPVDRLSSTAAPTPHAPADPPTSLTVKSGDTLGKIARRLGVPVQSLLEANQGRYPSLATNADKLQVGWTLSAPGAAAPQPARTASQAWTSGPAQSRGAAATGTVSRADDLGHKLAAGGAQSIALRMKQHQDAIDKTGVGIYFGDHSSFKTMTAAERRQWVAQNARPGTTPANNQKESSCIGWAMENVGAAYAAAGKSARWAEIQRLVVAKGSKGIDLAKELQKDGWQSVYWNPDAKHPDDGNPEHTFSAAQVARGKGYYGLKVDAVVENYRPTDPAKTTQDLSGIDKLSKVPFFFGMAKGGMHTFVGRSGSVNEFHWTELPDSKHAIQETPLKDWGWNSGVIMVPPGTWPKS